ncbi:MAG TPA: FISUMP domain-containing protein [Bacteroidales bacterium]|nr:FISUMP domain-containing protein [Bacteroidales bacterium]HRZ49875.1 FISUMP domain-containing protein [Bacteroidales bacterium]
MKSNLVIGLVPVLLATFFSCAKVELPVLTTAVVTAITPNSASAGGNITSDGGGAIREKGVCWSTAPNPTIAKSKTEEGKGTGSFTSSITGLSPSTTYYVRAYATNKAGTSYGNEVVFSTSLADADGNVYNTVQIGNQVWMSENLRTTKYTNGTPVEHVTDDNAWYANSTGAYTWYNNDPSQKEIYGALYKWHAVSNPAGLCPHGWHVPANAEWNELITFLGGETEAGSKLKESGNSHWFNQNTDATNTSGFTALPGGSRSEYGIFANQGYYGYFWTSTTYNMGNAWGVSLSAYDGIATTLYANIGFGYSVRCIRDAP